MYAYTPITNDEMDQLNRQEALHFNFSKCETNFCFPFGGI